MKINIKNILYKLFILFLLYISLKYIFVNIEKFDKDEQEVIDNIRNKINIINDNYDELKEEVNNKYDNLDELKEQVYTNTEKLSDASSSLSDTIPEI